MKKLFEPQTHLKSYAYPIIKIIIFTSIIIVCYFRDHIFNLKNQYVNSLFSIFCVILSFVCIFLIYVSVAEVFFTYSNKKSMSYDSQDSYQNHKFEPMIMEDIVSLVEENYIIEIEILYDSKTIKIGSSSDCKSSNSVFFDKEYYVGQNQYTSISDFHKQLVQYSYDGMIHVISIDGISRCHK